MNKFTGHHTCSMENGHKYVLANAPFISKWEINEALPTRRNPYLGCGYYFWEFDIQQAKKWGDIRYKDGYYILEGTINATEDNFLDLVGDKQKMGYLLKVASKLVHANLISRDWKLGELIEYLKKATEVEPDLFPWTIIRAVDYKSTKFRRKIYFRDLQGFTILEPIHIFCLISCDNVTLSNKKIIFQSKI